MKEKDKSLIHYEVDCIIKQAKHYKVPIAAYSQDEAKEIVERLFETGDLEISEEIKECKEDFEIENIKRDLIYCAPLDMYKVCGNENTIQKYEILVEAQSEDEAIEMLENRYKRQGFSPDQMSKKKVNFNFCEIEKLGRKYND